MIEEIETRLARAIIVLYFFVLMLCQAHYYDTCLNLHISQPILNTPIELVEAVNLNG
jgi:hypothetical protein